MGPWIGYLWARTGAEIARFVPPSVAPPLLGAVAAGYRAFSKRRMLMIDRHLRKVRPEASYDEIEKMVSRSLDLYARYWYESFRAPHRSRAELASLVETEGEEAFAEAFREGNGLITALPHLGNWDLAGAYVAEHYARVLSVAELLTPEAAYRYWARTRERLGIDVVALDGSSRPAREAIRALREGRVVALPADRDLTGDGVTVDFFGEKTTVPAGPATLALKTGAPLFCLGMYMLEGWRHRAVVSPPIRAERTGNRAADIARVSQEMVGHFEELIRREPEQWHLFTPNWPSDWDALGEVPPWERSL